MSQGKSNRKPVQVARERTGKVQQDLHVASAELDLTHGALERHLPPEVKQGDVDWAIKQNAAIGRKVRQAAEELEEVTELLGKAGDAAA